MTIKQFVALERELLPALPGFAVKGQLMFKTPVGPIFQTIVFDSSRFNKTDFYIQASLIPLYTLRKQLTFPFSYLLGMKNIHDPHLIPELHDTLRDFVLPYFVSAETPEDIIGLANIKSLSNVAHYLQIIAYSYVYIGKYDQADPFLDHCINAIRPEVVGAIELKEQVEFFRSLLHNDPQKAKQQLLDWEVESLKNLGLENFR